MVKLFKNDGKRYYFKDVHQIFVHVSRHILLLLLKDLFFSYDIIITNAMLKNVYYIIK